MRVAAFNPEVTSTQRATFQDPDPATWRMLELEMPKSSGGVMDITMLRPLAWLDAHNIVVGGSVALDMPELGAQGNARVLGVYPCPEIKSGPGQVITATFAHPSTFQVLDVTIGEGEDAETIGVTDNHPFWSETHQAFVPIGQLSVGDELLTLHGQKKRLTVLLPRPGPPERVYNLEVHGEHTYYVGHQQLLVHNNYPDEIFFGQKRISPNFRNDGPVDWLRGESIEDVAKLLRDGTISSDDILVQVFRYKGKLYAENNRALAALQLAGKRPTNVVEVALNANRKARIDEMHELGLSGNMIAVTTDKTMRELLYTVFRILR